MTGYNSLLPHHWTTLKVGSGISEEVIKERGYFSVKSAAELAGVGFTPNQFRGTGIIIPLHSVSGEVALYVYRPDGDHKSNYVVGDKKYLFPKGSQVRLDVPPRCLAALKDPSTPLFIVEGQKKADKVASEKLTVVGVLGIWLWGSKNARPDWDKIALKDRTVVIIFDSDPDTKTRLAVLASRRRLTTFLRSRGAKVMWVDLPCDGRKMGVDDYLVGHTVEELRGLVKDATNDNLPTFRQNRPDVAAFAREIWEVLLRDEDNDPVIYRGAGGLVCLDRDIEGQMVVLPASLSSITYLVSDSVIFLADKYDHQSRSWVDMPGKPPLDVMKLMLDVPDDRVPVLRGVVGMPYFAKSGRLVSTPGYDGETKLYFEPMVDVPPVTESPTQDDVKMAMSLIDEMIQDFPFAGEADRANALAMMLEVPARELIDGKLPMHKIDSPTQGSGKGLLVQSLLTPVLGHPPAFIAPPDSEAEMSKILTTAMVEGSSTFIIDNISHALSSASLAEALTVDVFEGRILGASKYIRGRIRWSWAVTGNNITVDADLDRRLIQTRLVPDVERPWVEMESRFKIVPLESWVAKHIGELAWSAMTLVQNWVTVGMPKGERTLGTYESWSQVIGGILAASGVTGFLGNLAVIDESADTDTSAWREFVGLWWTEHGSDEMTVSKLLELADLNNVDLRLKGDDVQSRSTSMGWRLRRQRDRLYGDHRIVKGATRGAWALQIVERK